MFPKKSNAPVARTIKNLMMVQRFVLHYYLKEKLFHFLQLLLRFKINGVNIMNFVQLRIRVARETLLQDVK